MDAANPSDPASPQLVHTSASVLILHPDSPPSDVEQGKELSLQEPPLDLSGTLSPENTYFRFS